MVFLFRIGFSKTKEDALKYREAEIKHSRLAMLAAAGQFLLVYLMIDISCVYLYLVSTLNLCWAKCSCVLILTLYQSTCQNSLKCWSGSEYSFMYLKSDFIILNEDFSPNSNTFHFLERRLATE